MLPATPTRLGRYEIVEEIGRGAMGVVYLAKDPLIGRQVALKTFRVAYTVKDEELQQFRSRFMREAQSAGILSHPNIVTIHDVVTESEEGATFIAMEFVRGRTLKEMVQGAETMERDFVVDIVSQMAEALDYAHSKGVIHRDVKPANVLITPEGKVKITDFGIARVDTSNLTHEGQLLGTPNYMAPEQILGRDVDHRADIFALGVVLYESLTRRKPFSGENLTVVSHRVVYESFTPPEEFVPEFPAALRAVLQRALEKSPDKRYQRAGELAADLRRATNPPLDLNATLVTLSMPAAPAPAPAAMPVPSLAGAVRPESNPLTQALHDTFVGRAAPPPAQNVLQRRRGQARAIAIALAGAAVALAMGLAGLALFDEPGPAVASKELPGGDVAQAMPWLLEGGRRLEQGDAAGAVVAFREAERLAPDLGAATQLRVQASTAAEATAKQAEHDQRVLDGLQRGQDALRTRDWETARAAAIDVLRQDPESAEARDMIAQAEAGLARRRAEARTASLPVTPAPAPVPQAPAAQEVSDAALAIDFQSEAPEGVLTVFVDGSQILREPFRFVRRKGLFRSQAIEGGLQAMRQLAPGDHSLRVYVALSGKPARLVDLQGSFQGGAQRTLRIQVTKSGEPSASLE